MPTTRNAGVTDAHRTMIVDALADPKPFYCEGVWTLSPDHMNLYIAKDPHRVCLAKGGATTADLEKLAAACAPATFGMNQNNVYDESYRKAGKLDRADFGINLDIVGSGLLHSVQNGLFGWEKEPRNIKAELYKLNVYKSGSFFKAHKDTPRGDKMFGSLVLTFPTEHQGGALVLRHDGRETLHDPSKAAYTIPEQVSWVAFYSDVEHEVLPVSSGYRVTLTYNLYFLTSKASSRPSSATLPFVNPVVTAFESILADPAFMPHGGRLGFGLKHQYPVPMHKEWDLPELLIPVLKGGDSALFHAADAAGLEPCLALIYNSYDSGTYLMEGVLPEWNEQLDDTSDLFEDVNAELLDGGDADTDSDWASDDGRGKSGKESKPNKGVEWITPRNDKTRIKTSYVTYGNEVALCEIYGDVVLILTVPPASKRV